MTELKCHIRSKYCSYNKAHLDTSCGQLIVFSQTNRFRPNIYCYYIIISSFKHSNVTRWSFDSCWKISLCIPSLMFSEWLQRLSALSADIICNYNNKRDWLASFIWNMMFANSSLLSFTWVHIMKKMKNYNPFLIVNMNSVMLKDIEITRPRWSIASFDLFVYSWLNHLIYYFVANLMDF